MPHANLCLASGYDFGYWVKLLTGVSLPTTEESFFDLLRIWFPTVYDIKFLMRTSKVLKGGLQDVADDLGVGEISPPSERIYSMVACYIGDANWTITPSRLRLTSYGGNVLQNAGDIF
jgi:hypothetical protein